MFSEINWCTPHKIRLFHKQLYSTWYYSINLTTDLDIYNLEKRMSKTFTLKLENNFRNWVKKC